MAQTEERQARRWAGLIESRGGSLRAAVFGVGAILSIFIARAPFIRGMRMLGIGLLACGITYTVGWLLGVSVIE